MNRNLRLRRTPDLPKKRSSFGESVPTIDLKSRFLADEWNPMWSSAVVSHPPRSPTCAFWGASLLIMVIKSAYVTLALSGHFLSQQMNHFQTQYTNCRTPASMKINEICSSLWCSIWTLTEALWCAAAATWLAGNLNEQVFLIKWLVCNYIVQLFHTPFNFLWFLVCVCRREHIIIFQIITRD